jgi:hypothetical protein
VRPLYAEFYLGGVARALSADGSHDPELAPVMERRADAGCGHRAARWGWPCLQNDAVGPHSLLGQGREDRCSMHQRAG